MNWSEEEKTQILEPFRERNAYLVSEEEAVEACVARAVELVRARGGEMAFGLLSQVMCRIAAGTSDHKTAALIGQHLAIQGARFASVEGENSELRTASARKDQQLATQAARIAELETALAKERAAHELEKRERERKWAQRNEARNSAAYLEQLLSEVEQSLEISRKRASSAEAANAAMREPLRQLREAVSMPAEGEAVVVATVLRELAEEREERKRLAECAAVTTTMEARRERDEWKERYEERNAEAGKLRAWLREIDTLLSCPTAPTSTELSMRVVRALARAKNEGREHERAAWAGAVKPLLDLPYTIDEATVPAAGAEAAPEQVVGTLTVSLAKMRALRSLAAQARPSASEG